MKPLSLLLLPFVSLAALVAAKSSTGDSVLVVLEPGVKRADYSQFFGGLEKKGYNLTFRAPKDVSPEILDGDHPNFSHVILFTPETKNYAQDLSPQNIVQLLSANTNLLIALGPKQTPITSLVSEFSLIPSTPGTPLVSHWPPRDEPVDIIPITPSSSPFISTQNPIWFQGACHALGNSPMVFPILRAPAESVASDAKDDKGGEILVDAAGKGGEGLWAGSSMSVVSGFQTKTGARAVFVGGIKVFSDEFANKEVAKGTKSGNAAFAQDIASWAFQESLVLRIDSTTHHKVNQTESLELYTTNDQLVYEAQISQFKPKTGTWEPYSDLTDLQLEFTMLDPFIRTALSPVPGQPGKYAVQFRAPDRHGVYKFVLDYKRKGYSYLQSTSTVSVVPPRHDGYPRFLSAAWPYYVGAISTSIGFVLFSVLYLGGEGVSAERKGKGKKE